MSIKEMAVETASAQKICGIEKAIVRARVTRFGTMDTMPPRLGEKGTRGPDMSRPTRPEDPGQEAHYRGRLEDT
jgi:hypothetical protein